MKTLCIIQCAKTKKDVNCPAIEMYSDSALFKNCTEVAQQLNSDIIIVSTKHGFLYPETIIEPYDYGLDGGPMLGREDKNDRKKRVFENKIKQQHFYNKMAEQKEEFIKIFSRYDKIYVLANTFYQSVFKNLNIENEKFECWFEGSKGVYFLPGHLKAKVTQELQARNSGTKAYICLTCKNEFWNKRKSSYCSQTCRGMMWKQKNPEKRKISDQKYINNNKEKIKENFEKWIEINKEKHRKTTMKYKEKNREKILKYSNEWNKNNSDKIHNWNKEQYQNSSEYRIKSILYVRLNQALKAQDSPKFHHTLDLIGCTPEFLVNYLEEKMSDDMKLNRDLVDIDHIIPINTFDLNNVEEQKKCFHYTNLRPIFRKDNQSRPKDGSDFSPENGVSDNS